MKINATIYELVNMFKSSYLNIVKDRFLPPPLSVLRKDGLLKWVKGDSEAHYLSLTQNIAMKDQLNSAIIKKYPIIPYDYSCPSVQPHLRRRICSDCNMYFATFKELDLHKDCHKRKKSTKKQTSLFPSPISSGSTPAPQPSPPSSPPPPRGQNESLQSTKVNSCALLPTKNWSGWAWVMSILRVLTFQMKNHTTWNPRHQ